MQILPYLVDKTGNLRFYLDKRYHTPRLFSQPVYLDGSLQTQITENLAFLTLKSPPTPKQSISFTLQKLKKLNIHQLKPYYDLLHFLNDNNKNKLDQSLKQFKTKLELYTPIDITFKRFTPNQQEKYDHRSGLKYITIPENTIIYKSMPPPLSKNKNQSRNFNINNSNPRSEESGWFGTLETAKKYAVNANRELKEKGIEPRSPQFHRVYAFKFIKTVKLFYLMDFNNIYKLLKKLKTTVMRLLERSTAEYSSMSQTPRKLFPIDTKELNQQIRYVNTIKMLTGFQLTYRQQLEYIKRVHIVFKRKIESEVNLLNHFYNHERNNRTKRVRYRIDKNYHSDLSYDLNRISIGTEFDRSMLRVLQRNYSSFDGYINHRVPSMWEYNRYGHNKDSIIIPTLDDEIGLFVQKGFICRQRSDPHDNRIFL